MALKANVGDFIQYRFTGRGGFAGYNTRRVIELRRDSDGQVCAYLVEGAFVVMPKDILTVIPMHQEQESLTSDASPKLSEQRVDPAQPLGGRGSAEVTIDSQSAAASEHRSLTTSEFPLEAGQ